MTKDNENFNRIKAGLEDALAFANGDETKGRIVNKKIPTEVGAEIMAERPKQRRGFAAMDPEKRRAIAKLGGTSVPDHKRSYSQNRDLAAAAGRKGGKSSHGGGRPRKEDD